VSDVNPHYLDHVVKLSETSDIEASEDIVSGTGMKLLAKGAKIDARARERLLEFRLTKPLENMMRVVGGTDPTAFHPIAEQLLAPPCAAARHLRIGARLRSDRDPEGAGAVRQRPVAAERLCRPGHQQARARVGVAVITSALGGSVHANPADTAALVIAALTHDIGELYIDPAFLSRGVKLTAAAVEARRHASDRRLARAGRDARRRAAHRQRRDGAPRAAGRLRLSAGHAGHQPVDGRPDAGGGRDADGPDGIGLAPRAARRGGDAAGARRVPPPLHRPRDAGARAPAREADPDPKTLDIGALETRVSGLAATISHVRQHHLELELQMARFNAPLRALIAHAFTRWDRIGIAFSSTGLDLVADERLHEVLSAMSASELNEVGIVLRELEWRMSELERALQIRSELFSPVDAQRVNDLIDEARQPMLLAKHGRRRA
jgi:hypothetical protein